MIGEEVFKDFCEKAEAGLHIHGLFITPNKSAREAQQIDMINMANGLNLPVLFKKSKNEFFIRENKALLRIAHPYLDREMQGQEFNFIHGLEYLNDDLDGHVIRKRLESRIRP